MKLHFRKFRPLSLYEHSCEFLFLLPGASVKGTWVREGALGDPGLDLLGHEGTYEILTKSLYFFASYCFTTKKGGWWEGSILNVALE